MFGIREFLKRNFSIEAMTTAVERKIASDIVADPTHPRNAVGGALIASIQSVRAQASLSPCYRNITAGPWTCWQTPIDSIARPLNGGGPTLTSGPHSKLKTLP